MSIPAPLRPLPSSSPHGTLVDAAAIAVRGIPIGELVSCAPEAVLHLAWTGALPSPAQLDRFINDVRAGNAAHDDAASQAMARALELMSSIPSAVRDPAPFVAFRQMWFAMAIATSDVDAPIEGFNAVDEAARSAAWIRQIAASDGRTDRATIAAACMLELEARGRLAGFGHPRVRGVDPRFVAAHAFAMRWFPADPRSEALQSAVQWAPLTLRHRGEPWANAFLPVGVILDCLNVNVREVFSSWFDAALATSRAGCGTASDFGVCESNDISKTS